MTGARALTLVLLAAFLHVASLRADFRRFASVPIDADMQAKIQRIADATLSENPKLTRDNLSLSVIELRGSDPILRAGFQESITYHPASVVKLFYLVAAQQRLKTRHLKSSEELNRALRDMIVDSSNDATSYVVDAVTDTSSGPELDGRPYRRFVDKRNWVNRYFTSMGYDINANGKTWCEGVYGREKQILGKNREYRNRTRSDQVAALMLWIVARAAVDREASEAMLTLMSRTIPSTDSSEEGQVNSFLGEGLPSGAKLWSKAGWTSEVRHDAALVELPNGRRYIATVLTRGDAANVTLLPEISRKIVDLFDDPPTASGN